jgi:predicted TIM-barrel fold metal-dependent hydrolase
MSTSRSRHPVDVHAFVGPYPYRYVPHPDPDVLVRVLEREEVDAAWVGHLPSAFWRDPSPGNAALLTALAPHAPVLRPVPTVRPDWPHWERELAQAVEAGAPAVRAYPPQWGLGPDADAMVELAHACAQRGLVLLLTVRFEDLRQRSRLDVAGDLQPAAVRAVVRRSPAAVLVTAAGRDFVEEVHWGLTPAEQGRVWYDLSWIWGPPEDHLAHLFRAVGSSRFVFGTGWPLRLTQTPSANLALLPDELRGAPLADPGRLAALVRAAAAERD